MSLRGIIKESYLTTFPAASIADAVNESLERNPRLVVTAPPGAGKSTLLPISLLDLAVGGKILMLEPRRIAARQIAERMAYLMNEEVGATIGYRIRFENRVSSRTRIEVLTEGILSRMMVDDPALEGVSVLIFDEFHERSLISDSALAMALETQKLLRPELRIVIMSATIDADAICKAIDAPLLSSEGRLFPVETEHCEEIRDFSSCAELTSRVIRAAHRDNKGDILAFLPGEAEIRRCAELLTGLSADTEILPLYGMQPPEEQRKAISPVKNSGRRIVLATPIAETSLTIEGINIVVDSGLYRKMVFDQQSGLSHMETFRVSMDMADQRRGRAGRTGPGVCYRLWSTATQQRMALTRTPEIEDADLVPMVLDLAAWGTKASALEWITPPSEARIAQAEKLLSSLGAIDAKGITPHGRRIASLPCHPRIAQMLVKSESADMKALATDVAALLEDRDLMPEAGCDISIRIDELRRRRETGRLERGWQRVDMNAGQYRRMMHLTRDDGPCDSYAAGALIAGAFPERVAKAHPDGCGRFVLAGGDIALIDSSDTMEACTWMAVANVNSRRDAPGRIFLAAPLDPEDVPELMQNRDKLAWDSRKGAVTMSREKNIGCLNVSSVSLQNVDREKIAGIICDAVKREGTRILDFSDSVLQLQRRLEAVSEWHPEAGLPATDTESLLAGCANWLPLYLGNATTAEELRKIDLYSAIWAMLDYTQQTLVDRLAPSYIAVPTGSRIRLDYRTGQELPVLRVRLQECFGMLDTPRVDDGKRPVLMELLSPGFKPVQLTSDLRSFWNGTYFEVRKELRRRYPKHSWPDNPLEAKAVRGVEKRKSEPLIPQ